MQAEGQRGAGIDFSCGGLRVVITGAGSGVGRVVAEAFLLAEAHVLVCDVSQDALSECSKILPDVKTYLADVSDPGQVENLFDGAKSSLGGLDVLVNNAGIGGPVASVENLRPEHISQIMSVNVNGMFHCARYAIPLLKQAGGGSIVNISSVAGRLGYAERAAYAASKWAVIGFTKSLANEVGGANIRVNAIMPGVIEGERHDRLYMAKAKRLGISFEAAEERFFEQVSLRRNVTPRDIAASILFFCSPAASNISGQALGVCGDIQFMRQ